MIPNSKLKISQLPFASGSEITFSDSIHLIKYPQKEGKQAYLSDVQSLFGSNFTASYCITAAYALNGGSGGTNASYVITASGANSNLTASYALTASHFSGLSPSGNYSTTIGDGVHNTYTIIHGLRTVDILYSVFDTGTLQFVIPNVSIIDTNTISVHFFNIPTTNQFNITVTAGNIVLNNSGSGNSVSASYATTASYALNGGGGTNASYVITASGANSNLTASYALTASFFSGMLLTGSFTKLIGDGINNTFTVVHNLNTTNLLFSMYDVGTLQIVYPNISILNVNSVIVKFFSVPTTNEFSLTISAGNTTFGSGAVTASYATTASYALNGGGGTTNTGSFVVTASGTSGNLTASYALNSVTASYSLNGNINTGSFVVTASGTTGNLTSSYALTASYFSGNFSGSYTTLIGDGVHNSYTITHNLGTKNLLFAMYDTGTNQLITPDVTFIDNNNILVSFGTVPSTNEYSLTISIGNEIFITSTSTSSYLAPFNGSGSLTGSAGSIATFLFVNINGTNYKMALYNL